MQFLKFRTFLHFFREDQVRQTFEHKFALVFKNTANHNTVLNKYFILTGQFWGQSIKIVLRSYMTARPDQTFSNCFYFPLWNDLCSHYFQFHWRRLWNIFVFSLFGSNFVIVIPCLLHEYELCMINVYDHNGALGCLIKYSTCNSLQMTCPLRPLNHYKYC